jgi:hypothetical protein
MSEIDGLNPRARYRRLAQEWASTAFHKLWSVQ